MRKRPKQLTPAELCIGVTQLISQITLRLTHFDVLNGGVTPPNNVPPSNQLRERVLTAQTDRQSARHILALVTIEKFTSGQQTVFYIYHIMQLVPVCSCEQYYSTNNSICNINYFDTRLNTLLAEKGNLQRERFPITNNVGKLLQCKTRSPTSRPVVKNISQSCFTIDCFSQPSVAAIRKP